MRDRRLDQRPSAAQRWGDARTAADTLADADAVVSGLTRWCQDELFCGGLLTEPGNEDHGLSDLLALPGQRFPAKALLGISDASRQQTLEDGLTALIEGRKDDSRDALAWLFGRALATALGTELEARKERTANLIVPLWDLINSEHVVRHSFSESLRERLRSSPAALAVLLCHLTTVFDNINTNPGSGVFSIERDDFVASIDLWRSRPSIDRLWNSRDSRYHYGLLNLVAEILPIARADVLRLLSNLDFPDPIGQILEHGSILHDRDAISATLKDAPSCSIDGHSWNKDMVALLVLRTVDDHCNALWRAVRQADSSDYSDAEVTEQVRIVLLPWFEDLGRITMARPDAQFLGPQWLFMKVADERVDRSHRRHGGAQYRGGIPQSDLIEWISLGLFKAGLTATSIAGLVEFTEVSATDEPIPPQPPSPSGKNTQSRFGALVIMSFVDHLIADGVGQLESTPPTAHAKGGHRHLRLLDALLACRDSAFEVEARLSPATNDLPASCFGYLLASVDDPAERWRQSWDLLTEQRRRAQHWTQTNDGDALAPSLFLLAVGTSGIAWLLSPPIVRPYAARNLWRQVFDGARECWLTITLSHLTESIETHIKRLFAWHPTVFDDAILPGNISKRRVSQSPNDYGSLLAQDLGLLGGDDLMLATCCLNAYFNGATEATMHFVLKLNQGHVDSILRQFERWQELERPVRRSSHVVAALTGLRNKIGETGPQAAAAPRSAH